MYLQQHPLGTVEFTQKCVNSVDNGNNKWCVKSDAPLRESLCNLPLMPSFVDVVFDSALEVVDWFYDDPLQMAAEEAEEAQRVAEELAEMKKVKILALLKSKEDFSIASKKRRLDTC